MSGAGECCFMLNIPFALAIAGFTGVPLARTWPIFTRRAIRFRGIFLAGRHFHGGLQTILNEGNDLIGSMIPCYGSYLFLVIVAVPIWIVWELGERWPAVDLRSCFGIGIL